MEVVSTNRLQIAWMRLRDAVRNTAGWSLEKFRTPARLKPFEFVDPITNETVYVYTDRLYSVLCVGQRRFYFDRITGAYDGTSSALPDLVSGRVELAD
jgi:hypothetical protein